MVRLANAEQVTRIHEYLLANELVDARFIETHRLNVCRWNSTYISSQKLNSVHITFSWISLNPVLSRKRVASADGGPKSKKAPFNDPEYNLDLDGIGSSKAPTTSTAKPSSSRDEAGQGTTRRLNPSVSPSSLILHEPYGPEIEALREAEHAEEEQNQLRDRLVYDIDEHQRQVRTEEAAHKLENQYTTHHVQHQIQMNLDTEPYLPRHQQGKFPF